MNNILLTCNCCGDADMHVGCHMGYCVECCPAEGKHFRYIDWSDHDRV